ncbi:MAG: alpha/beta hydrolase [Erysipelotrichaceae bacterium]|nr:alpha/beta hydrolase [Erysipelotrichaceae bacterium]
MYYRYYKNSNVNITIVLLHGWGVDSKYMESLKDLLIEDYSILLIDLPGHGESKLNKEYNMDNYIDELFYIVTKENIKNLYGIGHSFGGKVLSYYSLKYPLLGGILIAPSTYKPQFSLSKYIKIYLYKLLKRMHLKIPKFLLGSQDYRLTDGIKRKTFLNVVNFYLSKNELNKIITPIIIMGFKYDHAVKIKQLKKLNKYFVNSKLFIYDGDHFSYFSYLKEIKIFINYLIRGEFEW